MISLQKSPIPAVLAANAAEWTRVLLEKIARGEAPTKAELSRYNHADVKTALVAETHGKCAYCESKVRHIAYGDIEHIAPKAQAPNLRYEWSNLTIACDVCNTKKSNHQGIIDPYSDVPDEHLAFEGPFVWAKPDSAMGVQTEATLELNRIELLERRRDRLAAIWRLVALATSHADPNVRETLRRDLMARELAPNQEYTAMCRAVVARQFPAPAIVATP